MLLNENEYRGTHGNLRLGRAYKTNGGNAHRTKNPLALAVGSVKNISEPQLIRLIDAHIKKECPNYYKGFCDAKDKPCSWHREEEPFTNRGITCGWLRDGVLPLDKELLGFYEAWKQAELIRREKKDAIATVGVDANVPNIDTCAGCRQPMVVKSNRQKYCEACRKIRRLSNEAARVRKSREPAV